MSNENELLAHSNRREELGRDGGCFSSSFHILNELDDLSSAESEYELGSAGGLGRREKV